MRPATIVTFERLIFATLALGLVQAWLNRERLMPGGSLVVLLVMIVMIALLVFLTLLVSRRRSKVAMWISIILWVLGLPALVRTMLLSLAGDVTMLAAVMDILQNLIALVAYAVLFMPSARRWLNKEVTLDDLGETFA
jgi:hypothetical protein